VPVAAAAEAAQRAAESRFDVLVSDVGQPDGDGYQLMSRLRQLQPDLPGIALSGYGMEDNLQRSKAAGYAVLLVKPVGIETL
jgi:CheY-like chemotaxis protein